VGEYSEEEMIAIWSAATDNQRACMIDLVVPRDEKPNTPAFVTASKALHRRGVTNRTMSFVAHWAIRNGYARNTGERVQHNPLKSSAVWEFSAPAASAAGRTPRVDGARLQALVREGKTAAQIAAELDVSRQGVYVAVKREGLTLAARPVKPPRPPRPERAPRSVRLVAQFTEDEAARLRREASERGVPVSVHMRALCFPTEGA
jgi:hypothetical protein